MRKRRFGAVVRIEVSSSVSQSMLGRLAERLGVAHDQVFPIHGLLDLGDVDQLYGIDRPDLKYEPWLGYTQRRLARDTDDDGIFDEVARRDIVVQHPYDSFATSVESFVQAAAVDPHVVTLKTTVYRTSRDSAIAPALIKASENGKQAVCVVELKARFDEQRNIEWARALEQAGVHVVYGFPDMKIHAKTTLVVRREGDELRRYVHIGTGNYHATTARIYEDLGLFSADPEIAADVADLFNFVTGFGRPQRFRKLLVAPFNLRKRILEHIRDVAVAAEAGRHTRIRLKCNSLTDTEVIEELYRASQAGVDIDVIVRANCSLIPGVEGMSERIHVRSILGRFLEHSRLYCFEIDEEKTYLHGERRPDAAQPRSPDRGRRADRGHARPQRGRVHLQGPAGRQLPGLDARAGRLVVARPPEEVGAAQESPRPRSCAAASVRGGSPGAVSRSAVVWGRHDDVVVGVVDVGSNTVRLLVTRGERTCSPSARCCTSAPTSSGSAGSRRRSSRSWPASSRGTRPTPARRARRGSRC